MEFRMRNHQLTKSEIGEFLSKAPIGRLATHNLNGFPYVVPVHFIYQDDKIYVHGLNKGQKLDNIKRNPKVCFEADEMIGLLLSDCPCDVNTEYNSVVALGTARLIEDSAEKTRVLEQIIAKYTPQLSNRELPPEMVNATAIIEVTMVECTGKYYQ